MQMRRTGERRKDKKTSACVCVDSYLKHELVFGDPLDGLQQVGIQRQFVVQFLLAFLLSQTPNILHQERTHARPAYLVFKI